MKTNKPNGLVAAENRAVKKSETKLEVEGWMAAVVSLFQKYEPEVDPERWRLLLQGWEAVDKLVSVSDKLGRQNPGTKFDRARWSPLGTDGFWHPVQGFGLLLMTMKNAEKSNDRKYSDRQKRLFGKLIDAAEAGDVELVAGLAFLLAHDQSRPAVNRCAMQNGSDGRRRPIDPQKVVEEYKSLKAQGLQVKRIWIELGKLHHNLSSERMRHRFGKYVKNT